MAIQPPDRPTLSRSLPLPGPGPRTTSKATADSDAHRAEKEANNRISQAQRMIEEAEKEEQRNLDYIRDSYEKQSINESARNEASLESERMKAYEQVRDLRRAQQAELNRVRREGEKDLADLQSFYRNAIYETEKQNSGKLRQLQVQNAMAMDHETRTHEALSADSRSSELMLRQELKEENDAQTRTLSEGYRKEYERMKSSLSNANEQAEASFQQRHESVVSEQDRVLGEIHSRASEKLQEIRQDTARKLAAYSSRQKDPFYQLVDIGAEIEDAGDSYRITATIPEHEQSQVSISLRGNQLVIAGHRRNEEKMDGGDGHARSTSSYQSFSESFPLPLPVEGKQLSKAFDGDQLIVSVPKKFTGLTPLPVHSGPKPERAKVQRPQFPGNLPLPKTTEAANSPGENDGELPPPTKGSRTLI